MVYTLKKLSKELGFTFSGDSDLELTHVCGLNNLTPGGVSFITDPKGLASIPLPAGLSKSTSVDLDGTTAEQITLIVAPGTEIPAYNLIFTDDPLVLHAKLSGILHPKPAISREVHPSAVIGKNVSIGNNVSIGPCAVLYDNVAIGDNTVLHAGVIVLSDAAIGKDCLLAPNVVVSYRCILGDRVVIHPNAVIGADGHGYYQREGINHKIPQIGNVIIEDDVEIGACSTIDRGRLEDTIIRQGCKIDDQVLIAHNVEVGPHALISGQTAIGGSTKTGHHLVLGGQSGIRDNVTIGNNVAVVARGAVFENIKDDAVLGGVPAKPIDKWKRVVVYSYGLQKTHARIKALEKEIKALKQNK